ncbi:MAG: hypothetical protein M3384_22370 [Acidobacteriota bacterium]|nr:hypothetical protein [Acidobacteriota bacterium]
MDNLFFYSLSVIRRNSAGILIIILSFASLAFGLEKLPCPTGQHALGRTSFRWVDKSRPEVMTDALDDYREIIVHLWYPAERLDKGEKAPYFPNLELLKKVIKGREVSAWQSVETCLQERPPVASAEAKFPVLIFSHGNMMNSALYSFLIGELVSRGYIVAAIDHPFDARGVILSDGSAIGFADEKWSKIRPPAPVSPVAPEPALSDYERFYRERVKVRAADASFVLNQLEKMNSDQSGTIFGGRFDLNRAGVFGHSVGGVMAGEVCRSDIRFKACLNLDGMTRQGPFYLDDSGKSFVQPFMIITKPFSPPDEMLKSWKLSRQRWQEMKEEFERKIYSSVESGSRRVVVKGATHQSFSDDPMLIALLTGAPEIEKHRRILKIINDYTLAFFDKYLKNNNVALLDKFSADNPEVILETWLPANSK